jgi:hypothetical protein
MAVVSHFLDVLRTEAWLDIVKFFAQRVRLAQEIGNKLLHAGSGEKGGRIVFGHEGDGGNFLMVPIGPEIAILFAEFPMRYCHNVEL